MRVIQIQIPHRQQHTVLEILESEGIDYTVTNARNGNRYVVVVEFPIPRQAVGRVLGRLRAAEVDVDGQYRVNLHADVARTENLDDLVDRFVKGSEETDFIACEELKARARDLNPSAFTYYAMTMLAMVVATSGLLLNSPAVVVGSMVLAPQLGAALTASVGVVTNDREMIVDGFVAQVAGLGLGLAGSVALALALRSTHVVTTSLSIATVSQIGGRVSPGLLSIVVSLAAGTAAVLSLVTHDSPSGPLVGVMVSAALVPAAVTAGLGIAWGLVRVTIGATVLLVVNVVSINVTGPVVLWLLGYRPVEWSEKPTGVFALLRRHAPALLTLALLLSGFVGVGTVLSYQVDFDQDVRSSVDAVLDREEFAAAELRDVSTEYVDMGLVDAPQQIVVTVAAASGEPYPGLEDALKRRIAADTGLSVDVLVEFRNQSSSNDTDRGPVERVVTDGPPTGAVATAPPPTRRRSGAAYRRVNEPLRRSRSGESGLAHVVPVGRWGRKVPPSVASW
jgi:uncharacterized hydrophobic protein (TIGR00271 family)